MSESESAQLARVQVAVERFGGRNIIAIVIATFAAAVWATSMKNDNSKMLARLDAMEQRLVTMEARHAEVSAIVAAKTADRFTSRNWDAAVHMSSMQTPPVILPPFSKVRDNTAQP